MQRNRKNYTELDMMFLRAGWSPMTDTGNPGLGARRLSQPRHRHICRKISQQLKAAATRLDAYVLRVEGV